MKPLLLAACYCFLGISSAAAGDEKLQKPSKKSQVSPLVYFDRHVQRKVINLAVNEERTKGAFPLELDEGSEGLKLVDLRSYYLGLGGAGHLALSAVSGAAAMAMPLAGVAPIKGRTVRFERFAKNRRELFDLPALKLPFTRQLLDEYGPGESVYYESVGGMMYVAGMGNVGVSAGAAYVSEGRFKTHVSKLNQNMAYVKVSKEQIQKTTLFTGIGVSRVESQRLRQLEEGFSYIFNFALGEEVVLAYENLLAGSALEAQKLAAAPESGVVKVSRTLENRQGRLARAVFRIPFLFTGQWESGKVFGTSETTYPQDGSTTTSSFGVFRKESKSKIFNTHKRKAISFQSAVAVNRKENRVLERAQTAVFQWEYERDRTSYRGFNIALRLLRRDLGLERAFAPMAPRGARLGYLRLSAKLETPHSFTKRLIKLANSKQLLSLASDQARALIERYFERGDRYNLCVREREDRGRFDRSLCQRRYRYESKKALGRIQAILSRLSQIKDSKKYSEVHANLGRELARNRFVANAFFALDENCSLHWNIRLEGERFKKIRSAIAANPDCREGH